MTINHQSTKKYAKITSERRRIILIAISVFSLMMVFAGPLSPARMIFAQTMASSNTGTSSSSTLENMVLNLGTPLLIEYSRTINITNITHNIRNATFEGNGTFMFPPPSNGRNVSIFDSGYSLRNTTGGLVRSSGEDFLKTMDGKESATIEFRSFTPINSTMGVGIAYMKTNSTTIGQQEQLLASLNNTLMVYKRETISPTETLLTYWKWNPVALSSSISENMPLSSPSSLSSLSSSTSSQSGSSNGNISSPETMVLNLGTPLYIEHDGKRINITNITQNIARVTFEANGTFLLPTPNARNVSVIESGYLLRNTTGTLVRNSGETLIKTLDGKESATLAFRSFTPTSSPTGMGIGIAYMKTNSNTTTSAAGQQQQLALLNNTLMVYMKEDTPRYIATYWNWK